MTSKEALPVRLSALDQARFGIRTAIARPVTRDMLPDLLNFCRDNHVVLLIARCPTSEHWAVQAMEREGFSLMDTLVYYRRNLLGPSIPQHAGPAAIRPYQPGEEHAVKSVATEAFRGYVGHYQADPKLGRTECDAVYPDWAFRSCLSRDVADMVLVAELDGSIVGFTALRINSLDEAEGLLYGVSSRARRLGIYRSLLVQGMDWCLREGAACMVISTQITNIVAQRVWVQLGFEPSHSLYTFHKWFDEPGQVA